MPVYNADIAAIHEEIADLPEIQGVNPFRVRARRNGAGHPVRRLPIGSRCENRPSTAR